MRFPKTNANSQADSRYMPQYGPSLPASAVPGQWQQRPSHRAGLSGPVLDHQQPRRSIEPQNSLTKTEAPFGIQRMSSHRGDWCDQFGVPIAIRPRRSLQTTLSPWAQGNRCGPPNANKMRPSSCDHRLQPHLIRLAIQARLTAWIEVAVGRGIVSPSEMSTLRVTCVTNPPRHLTTVRKFVTNGRTPIVSMTRACVRQGVSRRAAIVGRLAPGFGDELSICCGGQRVAMFQPS